MSTTRLRSRGGLTPGPDRRNLVLYDTCAHSAWYDTGSLGLGLWTGKHEQMTDEVTPRFRTLKRTGGVSFNPMSKLVREQSRVSGPGSHYRRKTNNITCSGVPHKTEWKTSEHDVDHIVAPNTGGGITEFAPIANVLSGTDVADMIAEASTKVQSERGRGIGSNMSESLAEAQQSLRYVPGLLGQLGTTYQRARARDLHRKAAELWLGYRYAARPLMADVTHALLEYNARVRRMRQTTRAFGSISSVTSGNLSYSSSLIRNEYTYQISDTCTVRAMSLDEVLSDRAYKLGLTMKNLFTLPWELVPYSFVIDWIVNVGDFLGAHSVSPELHPLGACIVTEREKKLDAWAAGAISVSSLIEIVSPHQGQFSASELQRTRIVGLQAPRLLIKGNFRFDNVNRCLDALSLLRTGFR